MKSRIGVLGLGLSLALAPGLGSAGIIGFLDNFDAINDTGSTAHGFEIELEGLHIGDITDTFGGLGRPFPTLPGFDPLTSVVRYGAPGIAEYTNADGTFGGTRVTYSATFASGAWDFGTPSGAFVTPGDNCWTGGGLPGAGYGPTTPCDHFGVGTIRNATRTTYSWLVETGTPGQLAKGAVNLPAPAWNIVNAVPQGAPPGDPPVPHAIAQILPPPPPVGEPLFGEAIWVKVFTTELEDPVLELDDLIAGRPLVDLALGHTETEWQLLQTDPGNPDSGKLESGYAAPIGPLAASVIRRYEFFNYSGEYKSEDHEALPRWGDSHPNICGDLDVLVPNVCDPSLRTDVGNYLGAQNAAVNLDGPGGPVAAPEPGTYTLLLAGLGLLGFLSRRRKVFGA